LTFEAFLQGLSDENERNAVRARWEPCADKLDENGAQRQFVFNFDAEPRLPEAAWQSIKQAIMDGSLDAPSLQRALTLACRAHTLAGDPLPPPKPSPLGRAVTEERFVEILRDQYAFSTDDQKEQFMLDLLRPNATPASNRAQLRNKFLAPENRVMWAAFDGKHPGNDPFAQMSNDARSIRAQLGLDQDERGDLLLFEYALPDGITARFPTIADAYAGDTWLWFFRPARRGEPYGKTLPWPGCPNAPCPELVHESIKGNTLTNRIRTARER